MQDWEHECADSQRLEEFLDLYDHSGLSEGDRFALMALIVSSFDDWLRNDGKDEHTSERLRRLLLANFDLHERTVHYWCLSQESDQDNVFAATPYLREIWNKHAVRVWFRI